MTRQSVSVSERQDKMTKFGYPASTMSREPTRVVGLTRDATRIIAINREVTKYNTFSNSERVKPIINNRRGERSEKKWPLRGWEVEKCTDDGIVAWSKKQSQFGGKKGGKKKPNIPEAENIISPTHRCPCLEDLDIFVKQSLHSQFLPKEQLTKTKPVPAKDTRQYIKPVHVNDEKETEEKVCFGVGVITPVGYTERLENFKDDITDRDKVEIANYKEAKANGTEEGVVRERRSRSVPENHSKNNRDKADQRSTAYHRIKRFLKLSKYDDRKLSTKAEEDEDEGYASKTSSAETKDGSNSDSEVPALRRMFSSMIDLSELPSNEKENENSVKSKEESDNRVKFSYTHQPNILQIPADDTKMQLQRERPERIDSSTMTYTRLKREKEARRCNTTLHESQQTVETSTMYNIDSIKPMTLVLRKISIQDSEQRITAVIPRGKWTSQPDQTVAQSVPNSRANSQASSRAGSALSRAGSAVSRASSVLSKSAGAQDKSPRYPSRPCSRLSMRGNSIKETSTPSPIKAKEPTWCPKHSRVSLFERQPTYSIGDLLPAMDKNIYSKQVAKPTETPRTLTEDKTSDHHYEYKKPPSQEDGYMLLQKGMDILTGSIEKPTLGPPAFRPNQSRHPLIRNVTVVVEQNDHFSPIHVGNRAKAPSPQTRISSDKGPRPNMYEDRETQRKLKEAFTRFYQNRPKDIGKEFRRMQTMWKA